MNKPFVFDSKNEWIPRVANEALSKKKDGKTWMGFLGHNNF
jgi:hypothetical protein